MDDFGLSRFSLIGRKSVRIVSLYKNCSFPFGPYSKVACCPFSGPIAIASLKDSSSDKCFMVKIFTANGEQLSQIETTHLYEIFWTLSQKLVILNRSGRFLVYTASGKSVTCSYMDQATEALSICSAKLFYPNSANSKYLATGLACLKDNGQLFAVNDIEKPTVWRIPDVASRNAIPTVWAMLPSDDVPLLAWYTPREGFKMAGQGKSVTPRVADWMLTKGDYTNMVVSVDSESICLIHDSGVIQIVKTDLSTELYSIDLTGLNLNKNSLRILWCKEKQVMLRNSQNKITCVSSNSEPTNFDFHSEVHTCPEIDGLSVFEKTTLDIIVPISSSLKNVLSLDSKESGAYLYEAAIKYKEKNPIANDYVIQIGDNLPNAIKDCWAASLEVRLTEEEANLFSAAVFGQNIQKSNRSAEKIDFAKYCKYLRIIKFLHKRGVPISFAQFDAIGIDGIIDRLIEMGLYAAADIVAKEASPEATKRIVAHWALDAIANVSVGFSDEAELGDKIVSRFGKHMNVSFAATAEKAHEKGLTMLADRLLDLEEDVVQQVTTLLKMKQMDKALKKSAKSKDPDLLFMVIRHLKISEGKNFELTLQKIPHVFAMYKNLVEQENPDNLITLYKQSDDFRRQVLYYIGLLPKLSLYDISQLTSTITKAVEALNDEKATQLANLMTQHKILIVNNAQLEEKHRFSLIGKTLRETIMWAAASQFSLVDSLRKQYKVNEKQCWKWVVDGLSNAGEWDRLEQFVLEYKSGYGYLPIIRVFVKHGEKNRAAKFLKKMLELGDKVSLADQIAGYEAIGDFKQAAELAINKQEMGQLFQLRNRYPTESNEFSLINSYISKAQMV